jgi:hypothetical protein
MPDGYRFFGIKALQRQRGTAKAIVSSAAVAADCARRDPINGGWPSKGIAFARRLHYRDYHDVPRIVRRESRLSPAEAMPTPSATGSLRRTPNSRLSILRLLVVVSALCLTTRPAHAQTRSCQPAAAKAGDLRQRAIQIVTDTGWAGFRSDWAIPTGDSADVQVVAVDSVCDAVTHSIDLISSGSPRTSALLVVKFQGFYFATDNDGPTITTTYVLDDKLKVLTGPVGT